MSGFNVCINGNYSHEYFNDKNCFHGIMHGENYKCHNFMLKKFENDKLFYEDALFLVILDGVVLNKKDLEYKFPSADWFSVLISIYLKHGNTFFNLFKGSFSGALYDKANEKWLFFSDQIGSKFLYYYSGGGGVFLSSMINDVFSFMRQNKFDRKLSVDNAYLLLNYGYMLEDRTLCENIKKLKPGCYLLYEDGKLSEHRYYLFENTPNYDLSIDDAVELIDYEFRRAVKSEFEKDIEYNYQTHLVSLSGGLDSRMVSWVAHDLGFTSQLNFTYSQTDYFDEIIAKKIAEDLKHEWIFKALDNGLWLYDVDSVTKLTGGTILYYTLGHELSMSKYMNFDALGISHSGLLSDAMIGTYYSTLDSHKKFQYGTGAFPSSRRFIDKIKEIKLQDNYQNEEIFKFYNRAFTGILSGTLVTYNYTETLSPCYDVDFAKNVLSIPLKWRYGHYIYKKWILKKYPKAADYIWEKMGTRITEPVIHIKGNAVGIPYSRLPSKIVGKCRRLLAGNNDSTWKNSSMNPIAYYLNTNNKLNSFILSYFDDTIDMIASDSLRNDLLQIKNSGNAVEKIEGVSLLSAIKAFELH